VASGSKTDLKPWSSYTIDDPVAATLSDDVAALVDTGTGHRDGGHDFTGMMTGVYVRYDSGWKRSTTASCSTYHGSSY
jgi:hypothetical protein